MTVDELAHTDNDIDIELRDRALKQLKKKRDFHTHLVVYTLVNSCLVLVWFLTGADGFFWPIFPMAFWGIGLVMNGWDVYRTEDFTETEIQREMSRLSR